ncbi:hypothetical protein NC653_030704 [Populus alba x Populus x berolinensis]|uniref:CRC domain-containing protein n=1 Tax=Populus alba x Populus x berolinensis TaxID=444605 RepID=A0AAD6Q1S1_9ROSI|nr:hypothetical protein NC653_030704 [Populus alba x Populus x berolinensis]
MMPTRKSMHLLGGQKGKDIICIIWKGYWFALECSHCCKQCKAVKIETRASVKQEISEPPSPALNMTSVQDPAIKSIALTTVQTNFVPFDNKNKIMENAPHASMVVNEEFGISSPNMKRQKLENQGASCKRCNCKRSKCLKLYCECFAAGLYCIEPCSCLDCFNNPGHEGTVLETRGQIESRNPLAFAPKVIRNLDSASEFRETNKTPASARHKRGCNCKKSSCLKKYCECFQGGVGCSSYCRCEGCKNTFGCKSGVEEDDLKWEESKIHEDASDLNLLDIIEKGEDHPDLMPPSQNSSNCSPTSEVKSVSPNCLRVSPPHHGFGSSASWMILRSLNPSPYLNPSKLLSSQSFCFHMNYTVQVPEDKRYG